MPDLGNPASPNLECITSKLRTVLPIYETFLDKNIKFGNHPPLHPAPNKAYTARTTIPINYKGAKKGDLQIILFKPGDGTGNEDYFTNQDLIIPNDLAFRDKPERVFPRYKEGVLVEVLFPLFSIYSNSIHINNICLEELTIKYEDGTKTIKRMPHLGSNPEMYKQDLRNGVQSRPPFIQMTVGHMRSGERFGDPHAIYCPKEFVALQVVGFLAIREKDNPLATIIDKLAKISYIFK